MSLKQNIIHKLNNKQEMFVLSRLLYPLSLCVTQLHNVCLSLSECRLWIWQHTLQAHTHADTRVQKELSSCSVMFIYWNILEPAYFSL